MNTDLQRAVLYLRVSTVRQAERDLSIPDQRAQCTAFCAANRFNIVGEFVDAGASATTDSRPDFQRMLDAARKKPRPFDVIVVHSLSRFFRDAIEGGLHLRSLERAGVRVISVTQQLSDDPSGQLVRQILLTFDEYQSRENAKHTTRAMKQNAAEGFWNGAPPPFGYRTVEAGCRGDKVKKKLGIYETEAAVVRRIFALALEGEAGVPCGVKRIAAMLNVEGPSFRKGLKWSTGLVHRILTNETYTGTHTFNRVSARTREPKPLDEHVRSACPVIIPAELFAAVGASLRARAPARVAPRTVASPMLLAGLATCGQCGGGLQLRTGKSKGGAIHRYYTCSAAARKGKRACAGGSVREGWLDQLVEGGLAERVFQPDRLRALIEAANADDGAERARAEDEKRLRAASAEAEQKLKRLYAAVAAGTLDPTEPILAEQLAALRAGNEDAKAALARVAGTRRAALAVPEEAKLIRLAELMREKLAAAEVGVRRQLLRLFVSRVVVGLEGVRIEGPAAALAQAANENACSGVRTSVQEWRPVRDSNPCCQRERLVS